MDWLLFAEEATAAHYFWNGDELFRVSTNQGLLYTAEDSVSKIAPTLNVAKDTPRKKTFTLGKLRYIIVCKGAFHQL